MSVSNVVTAYPREVIGKANRRLAGQNRIPAVVYGIGRDAVSISVDRHDFELLMAHHAAGSTHRRDADRGREEADQRHDPRDADEPDQGHHHARRLPGHRDGQAGPRAGLPAPGQRPRRRQGGRHPDRQLPRHERRGQAGRPASSTSRWTWRRSRSATRCTSRTSRCPRASPSSTIAEEVICSVQAPRAEEVVEEVAEETEAEVIGEKAAEEE